jgi:hypothetical protein
VVHVPASLIRDSNVKRPVNIILLMVFFLLAGCHASRSGRSFDQIRNQVEGKTAEEVLALLGPPDSRQAFPLGDEQWIWWNYTYLGGKDYAPEVRGKTVHLQITFEDPSFTGAAKAPNSKWQAVDPRSVSFVLPQTGK